MNKASSLIRSIPYWLLIVLSLVSAAVGGWLVWDNTSRMQLTLLDGTATNIEVYVGQAWVTSGSALLAAGVVGILLALAIGAAKSLRAATAPVVVETIDWESQNDDASAHEASANASAPEAGNQPENASEDTESEDADDNQNGSSGSTATATNISVK